jgi:hypothetical protein
VHVKFRSPWPGYVATAFLVLATSLWTFWGIEELYFEGWGLPFPAPLAYLIPGGITLTLGLLAITFPTVGGIVVLLFGTWFTWWWWSLMYRRGAAMLWAIVSAFPGSAILIIVGILFLFEARRRRALRAEHASLQSGGWLRRHLDYVALVGVPLVILAVVSAMELPKVLARFDDGVRSTRVIEGNGVRLRWAPAGPGWNWKQPGGWIPSWDHLATYGQATPGLKTLRVTNGRVPHASAADMKAGGLCAYLSEDGRSLLPTRLGAWRMPTVDEMVRSLSRKGVNAGCRWNGARGFVACRTTPDKETPLWAPDQSPIYYWAADEAGANAAWYVAYNGAVQSQPKNFGNPRHGYRCVRDDQASPASGSAKP